MPSRRAGKNVKGATPEQIGNQAKKTFRAVGKAAKKINDTAANKITAPLARQIIKKTKMAVSDLEAQIPTTEAVSMKKGGAMKSKGMKKGGAMKAKGMMRGGAMKTKGMKKGGKIKAKGMAKGGKMATKGYAKGGAMKAKGSARGGVRKPSNKNSGLFG
jgi:hypothetical protein